MCSSRSQITGRPRHRPPLKGDTRARLARPPACRDRLSPSGEISPSSPSPPLRAFSCSRDRDPLRPGLSQRALPRVRDVTDISAPITCRDRKCHRSDAPRSRCARVSRGQGALGARGRRSIAAGVFGSPYFVVDGEPFGASIAIDPGAWSPPRLVIPVSEARVNSLHGGAMMN